MFEEWRHEPPPENRSQSEINESVDNDLLMIVGGINELEQKQNALKKSLNDTKYLAEQGQKGKVTQEQLDTLQGDIQFLREEVQHLRVNAQEQRPQAAAFDFGFINTLLLGAVLVALLWRRGKAEKTDNAPLFKV